MKKYIIPESEINILEEPVVAYEASDDRDIFRVIKMIRDGIKYTLFRNFVSKSPFSIKEWADFLHLSDRTMQRYEKEKKAFDPIQSEKIIQIAMLYKYGVNVFGSQEMFDIWLDTSNVALGKQLPKSFLDNSFGIEMLKAELGRIEHGVLA